MNSPTPNDLSILQAVYTLRYADREMLTALCAKPAERGKKYGFGAEGVKRSIERLKALDYLRASRYYKPIQKERVFGGSAREVLTLGPASTKIFNFDLEAFHATLSGMAQKEWQLRHEMLISKLHTALVLLDRQGRVTLENWSRFHSVVIDVMVGDKRFVYRPDARFCVTNGRNKFWFFLESDTGEERLVSKDKDRATIQGKLEKYGRILEQDFHRKRFPEMGPSFWVLFVTPHREKVREIHLRESNMMQLVQDESAHPTLFRFLNEQDIDLAHPEKLLTPVIRVPGFEHAATLVPLPKDKQLPTLQEPDVSSASPSRESEPLLGTRGQA